MLAARSTSVVSKTAARRSVAVKAGNWLPGQPRPAYLPESMVGSFGFDPLGLGKDAASLERFQEAEVIHCRWAMLGVAGALAPELMGYGDWVQAQAWAVNGGKATYFGAENPLDITQVTLFMTVAFAAAEGARAEAPKEKKVYPGFDFAGLSKDAKAFETYKLKEIKNGRLAMVAFVGFIGQHAATGKGPIAALAEHVASPFTVNFATNGTSIPGLL